jgi:ribosomal protein S18 acetylase RimI-like enzyme
MTTIKIKKLIDSEIEKIVTIHLKSLPEDFLPSLGHDFLLRIFYPAVLTSENAKILVAHQNKSVIGFVVVSLNSDRLLKEIISFKFFLFLTLLMQSAFSSLTQLKKIFGIVRSSFNSYGEKGLGEIYIIAVNQEYRGSGVGKSLVQNSIDYLKVHKVKGIKIKTLKENKSWISFFIKNGWKISAEFNINNLGYVVISNIF